MCMYTYNRDMKFLHLYIPLCYRESQMKNSQLFFRRKCYMIEYLFLLDVSLHHLPIRVSYRHTNTLFSWKLLCISRACTDETCLSQLEICSAYFEQEVQNNRLSVSTNRHG